mmetsp:Transcript_22317/g.32624  ORF Transcript_22317/g.32624 Transcript_22317/m.32624 type:complete len:212 (+) Transcript_22317:62-697(+)|eukprot:CAMPEP_0197247732 /NCGR_PEP_ID=MMETSP1429-20130617/31698_1 /TAXON_ID=49237 /ORGANISM="Chaetoceros  sp., Strain UNC1202" /LENGTH=211 /DNA_ID=CAMNT_0042708725 /DNA_START=50 /DNA_END=685 /DNA_ORIENTATION=+
MSAFQQLSKRSLSTRATATFPLPSRPAAVAASDDPFETHLNSATAKFRSFGRREVDRGQSKSIEQDHQEELSAAKENLFAVGGRLKRPPVSKSDVFKAEITSVGGKIVRDGHIRHSGGSIAATMSATAQHRQRRAKNEDNVIVSNPSTMTIPVDVPEEELNGKRKDLDSSDGEDVTNHNVGGGTKSNSDLAMMAGVGGVVSMSLGAYQWWT